MFRRRNPVWERYVVAARQAQGAGFSPAPAAQEPREAQEEKRRQASRLGRFARAAGRAAMAAARTAGGLLEFGIWLGLNLVIVLAVVLAAEAAGAHLPPWLSCFTNWVQAALGRLAALVR